MFKKNFFGKVKFIKAPAEFELMTFRFIVNALTHYATPLGNNFGGEMFIKCLILLFILIGSMSQLGGVPCHFKLNWKIKWISSMKFVIVCIIVDRI